MNKQGDVMFGVTKMHDMWDRRDPKVAVDVANICFVDGRPGTFFVAASGIYKQSTESAHVWIPVKD